MVELEIVFLFDLCGKSLRATALWQEHLHHHLRPEDGSATSGSVTTALSQRSRKEDVERQTDLNNLSVPSETSDILNKNTCRFFSLIWNGFWHCPLFPALNMLVFASRTGSLMLT